MIKFLRKNNRKLLTFSSIFLMISFLAARGGSGYGGRTGFAVGTIAGNVPVLDTDIDHARASWKLLKQSLVQQVTDPSVASDNGWVPAIDTTRNPVFSAIDSDPKLYCLLQKEAKQMGVVISDQEVQENLTRAAAIRLPDNRVVPYEQITDEDYLGQLRDAMGQLLLIFHGIDRVEQVNKISQPLRDISVAQNHQQMQVKYAGFDAAKYLDKVPTPTPEQLKAQFDQFADVEPTGESTEKNPFGFGYKIANQYRLQTISIPRRELKAAIQKTKSDYDWEVAARLYYRSHQADFQTEPKNTPPADALVTAPNPTTAPTTKPFEQVKSQVLDQVMAPDVTALGETVQKSIQATLDKDWRAYHHSHATSQASSAPAAAPDSSVGVAYDSYDYLKALALKVQQEFNVLPETAAYNQAMTSTELAKLPGIGTSRDPAAGVDFETAVTQPSTDLFEPSTALTGDDDSVSIFRLTDRIAAHRPASVNDVIAAVTTDWKKSQAYDLARKAANALLDSAKVTGLDSAAAAAGATVQTTGWFGGNAEPTGDAPPPAIRNDANKLLTLSPATNTPAPRIVEAPAQSKIFVAQLAGIRPDWPDGHLYTALAQAAAETRSEFSRPMQAQWFNLAALETRLGYVDLQKPTPG